MRKTSVCIPCFPRDTHKLFICFESINKQTLLPLEVIIGHSEMSDSQKTELLKKIEDKNYKFSVIISNTEKKAFAAENRNRAASIAKGEYISFFDSDDYMYAQRIETVQNLMENYNVKCVIHSHTTHKDFSKNKTTEDITEYNEKDIVKGKTLYELYKIHIPWKPLMWFNLKNLHETKNVKGNGFHHGHPTISRDVIDVVKQTETFEYRRGEDGKFIYDIFTYYQNKIDEDNVILYIPKPLTYYVESKYQ